VRKETLLLGFFILLKFVFQYAVIHPDFELHRDEFLHLDQADHLAWGYLSVPPLTSWISVLIRWLGNGEFWVRFFPALTGAVTLWLVWDMVKRLGGNLYAQSLVAIAMLCSALIRLNILFQPNSVDILCWTLVFYALVGFFLSRHPKWLYLLAAAFALGVLNKYNIVFLAIGLFPALLITPSRSIFREKHSYLALLMAILLVTPNLLWQYQNGFPVLTHMSLLSKSQLVHNSRVGFLSEQLLFFYPAIFVWLTGLGGLLFTKQFSAFRFIAWTFLFTLVVFTYFQAKAYYAIGPYPVLLGFGSVLVSGWLANGWRRKLKPIILILPPLLFLPLVPIIHPFYSPDEILENPKNYALLGLSRWEDGKDHPIPQDFADMLGWSELASLVDSAYRMMPPNTRTVIICDNYGQAGGINYYSKIPGLRALTMNADYLYWFDLEEKVDNLILVWEKDEEITSRETGFFEEYRVIGQVRHPLAREIGTKVHFLRGAKLNINEILEGEIAEEKKVWESRK
jgi:hypothetical protein